MRIKLISFILIIFFLSGYFLTNHSISPAYGETYEYQCESGGVYSTNVQQPFTSPTRNVIFTFNTDPLQEFEYRMAFLICVSRVGCANSYTQWVKNKGLIEITYDILKFGNKYEPRNFWLEWKTSSNQAEKYDGGGDPNKNYTACSYNAGESLTPTPTKPPPVYSCTARFADKTNNLGDITFVAGGISVPPRPPYFTYKLEALDNKNAKLFEKVIDQVSNNQITENIGTWPSGQTFAARLSSITIDMRQGVSTQEICSVPFTPGSKEPPITVIPGQGTPTPTPLKASSLCDNIKDDPTRNDDSYDNCKSCINEKGGVWTALGCIKTDISGFVSSFFTIGLGLAGGIALLFLIYGGFLVLTSAGNPETIQHGKEILTSAIAGLLLIIFSVFILRLVAVDILKIPGFG